MKQLDGVVCEMLAEIMEINKLHKEHIPIQTISGTTKSTVISSSNAAQITGDKHCIQLVEYMW